MQTANVKEQAHQLVENLPDSATWEDMMCRIYVREAIEAGIKDGNEGHVIEVNEIRNRFGLPT